MGYQDNDRFGRDQRGYRANDERGRYDRDRERYGRERSWREEDRERGDDDRGFFERAGDEVRSWFGDDEAERRRREDERRYGRERSGERWREGRGSDRDEWRGEDRWAGGGYVGGSTGMGGGSMTGGGFFRGDRAGDYGAGRGAGATGSWGLGAGRDREAWGYDPYRAWRDRQIRELDREYDEYCREHQSKFEQEYGTWRAGRQKQRQSLNQVRPHHEVLGSDGQHVGTVDRVQGDRIILTRTDAEAGGRHHSIPCSWIMNVGERIEINKTAEEAHAAWRDEETRGAMFGDQDRDQGGEQGPHILNRSFSGTY